ncbi:MAG: hypothetical protein JO222_14105 [Frankiales bacterium]|nr:hypothetical protein [Frankiales bacterium]
MDAYVFGRHDGGLPHQLVGTGEAGNRVRAVVGVEHDEHNVFVALEASDAAAADAHVQSLAAAGVTPHLVFYPDWMKAAGFPIPVPKPAWVPPCPWLAFLVLPSVDVAVAFVQQLIDRLGDDHVGAWVAADGQVVVEAVGDDADQLRAELDAAGSESGITDRLQVIGSVDDFHRAD